MKPSQTLVAKVTIQSTPTTMHTFPSKQLSRIVELWFFTTNQTKFQNNHIKDAETTRTGQCNLDAERKKSASVLNNVAEETFHLEVEAAASRSGGRGHGVIFSC